MTRRAAAARGHRTGLLLFGMTLAYAASQLDTTAVTIALPTLHREYETTIADLQWIVNGYMLAFAVLLMSAGRLGDIFGHRRLMHAGLAVFSLGAILAAASSGVTWLIAAIAVQGVGAAMMTPASLAIVSQAFDERKLGEAVGIWAGGAGLATALGPVIGGGLTDAIGWRAIFVLNVPLAVAIALLVRVAVGRLDPGAKDARVDYAGLVTFSVGLFLLAFAGIEGPALGGMMFVALAVAVALLVAFAFVERRARQPMLEYGLFSSRTFSGANAVNLIINITFGGAFFITTLYLQTVLDYSAFIAGVLIIPATLVFLVVAPASGWIAVRVGFRATMAVGMALIALAMGLFTTIDASTTYAFLWIPFVILGLGLGLSLPPSNTAVMEDVPTARTGAAAGILSTGTMVGLAIGVSLFGGLFQGFDKSRLATDLTSAGVHFTESQGQDIQNVLTGSKLEGEALAEFPERDRAPAKAAIKRTFVYGMTRTMWVAVGLALAGMLTALFVFRERRRPPLVE